MSEKQDREGIDAQSVALVGMFTALVAVVIIIGVQVLFYRMEKSDFDQKYDGPGVSEKSRVLGEQNAKLSDYKWKTADKEWAVIPIDRAMELAVQEAQGKKP